MSDLGAILSLFGDGVPPPGDISAILPALRPAHPRILVCCGEPSGDLYAAELVRELRTLPGLTTFGLGGDRLTEQGTTLLAHVRDLAVVGLFEVVKHLRSLRRVFACVLAEVDRARPDLAVLVDYPDFNLRLARELRRRGVPILYYVSPQVWAWRRGRIRTIRETVSHMAVIFPFEEPFYREAGVPVTFVGHPLVDLVRPPADPAGALRDMGLDPARPVVAVLPGSRPGEVGYNLPPLLGALERMRSARPDLQFALALAPSFPPGPVRERVGGSPVLLVEDRTHDLVGSSTLALVASGTATVETAILGTPMVVVYRIAPLSYLLGRPLVRVPHYAMVNLIAGRTVVPELIQRGFNPESVAREALDLLGDAQRTDHMRTDLAEVRGRLGGPGASRRVADVALSMLEKS